MTHYFKKYWNEATGDELTDAWGPSTYYFETDDELNVIRQIQVFEKGQVLKYTQDFIEDDFGMLADQQLDREELEGSVINKDEFTEAWTKLDKNII